MTTSTASVDVSPTARGDIEVLRGAAHEQWGDGISVDWAEVATPDPGPRPLLAWVILRVTVHGTEEAVVDVLTALAGLPAEPERMASVTRLLEVAAAATRIVGPHPTRVWELTNNVSRRDPIAQALVAVTDDDARAAAEVRREFMTNGLPWVRVACRSDWVDREVGGQLPGNVARALYPQECREQEGRG